MNGKMTNAVILIDMQQMYIDYLYDTKSKLIPSARTIIKAQKSVIKECIKYPFD
jgi:nicotinamidase-related amidase